MKKTSGFTFIEGFVLIIVILALLAIAAAGIKEGVAENKIKLIFDSVDTTTVKAEASTYTLLRYGPVVVKFNKMDERRDTPPHIVKIFKGKVIEYDGVQVEQKVIFTPRNPIVSGSFPH